MRVRCVANMPLHLPSVYFRPRGIYLQHAKKELPLRPGMEYLVYGIIFHDQQASMYLCTEDGPDYPIWYPLPLFEIVDSRASRIWRLAVDLSRSGDARIVPEDWARDNYFYDRLTDGDPEAVRAWDKMKTILEIEDQELRAL